MINNAEKKVSNFYNTVGWETEGQVTEDARRWEDLREHSKEYVSKCRLRVLRYIPDSGEKILDMASGPIQYKEYLEYSRNFDKRYCIDLSSGALEVAKEKIGDHGVFLHGSFFDIPLDENTFDCTISLHTIYHIDKDVQEEAVRKLIKVTKPGKPVIIVYSNPDTTIGFFISFFRKTKAILNGRKEEPNQEGNADIYFYVHPIKWWNRFNDAAIINIVPWRSFSVNVQKKLVPDSKLGSWMLGRLFSLEERFPDFFVNHFQYPMIVLTKK